MSEPDLTSAERPCSRWRRWRKSRAGRLVGWLLLAGWLGFVALLTALRYVVLPQIGLYQGQIEAAATQALGREVRIGSIEARWQGINPDLVLRAVSIADAQGQPALTLSQVESVLSWQTLLTGRLRLSLLAIEGPVLRVVRDPAGRISVAGMTAEGESDPAALEWLLAQSHIRIRNATIVWEDQLRRAPPLVLEDLQFGLDNWGRRHRFGLSAAPPEKLAARLDLRGEVFGDVSDALEHFAGRVFLELDYADLAGWRPWMDYPVSLPQGYGAIRLWGDLEEGEGRLTTDIAVEHLRLRLARHLPELDLASLRGRLAGHYRKNGWEVEGQRLEALTDDGVRLVPTDFHLLWRDGVGKTGASGEASASLLDLTVLRRLAAHLPLDETSRQLLERHRPEGTVSELKAKWQLQAVTPPSPVREGARAEVSVKDEAARDGTATGQPATEAAVQEAAVPEVALARYALRARFRDLGLQASGPLPGGQGFSGEVDASEKGGSLQIDAPHARLSLPAVFAEPSMAADRLAVRSQWRIDPAGAVDVQLERLDMDGPDATVRARGSYRYTGEGPGVIDLQASIPQADGTAVWRYIPRQVNPAVARWLRHAITAGRASEGKFVLKGDLRDFPFRDPARGTFYVSARAQGARLAYADSWPAIEQIDADMRFGVGMSIKARRGRILGAELSDVLAEIHDFEATPEWLKVRGVAQGPTAEFLRFIEQSPVGNKIDNFTDGMKASGNGRLDLTLDMPLQNLPATRVSGDFRFQNNQLQPIAALPAVTQAQGRLHLTENSITTDEISGQLLGGPIRVRVRSEGDRVAVRANGQATAAAVRQHFAWPLLDQLGGSAPWKAEINIRKRAAELVVESPLTGISSALPDPLNKQASATLPLRIERQAVDAAREQFRVTVGRVARGSFVQRSEGGASRIERAALAVGEGEAKLPEKGLNVQMATPRIDADAWKQAFAAAPAMAPGAAGQTLALNQVSLKTPQLHLMGRDYHNVDAALRPREGGWNVLLNMREVEGSLVWKSAGDGTLEGRLRRLVIPAGGAAAATGGEPGNAPSRLLDSLPGMSLTIDDLYLGERHLGQLEVQAHNDKGIWQLGLLGLRNPDFNLRGKGSWQNAAGRSQATRLDFDLSVNDIGRALGRLGFDETVRRGKAKIAGAAGWEGGLTAIDYPTLSGTLQVQAEKGQFNKLEPGIGKLLGLLSLQSLPRRLTLDFRDIFSDGLAFDSIEGKLAIRKGIMRTVEPLRIRGPAAKIDMQGEADLKAESQDLYVVVRPEISTVAAVGAALINPIAGAATLLGNSVLDSPINRLFSYRYHVTGNWADPKVEKAEKTERSERLEPQAEVPAATATATATAQAQAQAQVTPAAGQTAGSAAQPAAGPATPSRSPSTEEKP